MQFLSCVLVAMLSGILVVPLPLIARAAEGPRDFWVHPRGEAFDPARHYRDRSGELYYTEENDIAAGLASIRVIGEGEPQVRVKIGAELLEKARSTGGSLVPVLLYDSNGDGEVDRTVRGVVQGDEGWIADPALRGLDFRRSGWQLGIRYAAGTTGDQSLDGRYLASVNGQEARLAFESLPSSAVGAGPAPEVRDAEPPSVDLPDVGAGLFPPGLVVFRHREGTPFDLVGFLESPSQYIEHFEPLTRAADEDEWTVEGSRGRLVTYFDREDLLLVRTQGDFGLEVTWGDLRLDSYLADTLQVPPDNRGCYVSLNTRLRNPDETPVEPPHRVLYCPDLALALFDAPDGYEIGLSATSSGTSHEYTEAGTSVADNVRLYVREIYPRQPSRRGTGSAGGNIRAGWRDAGADLKDALAHAITGVTLPHLHTGQAAYWASPVSAAPRAILELLSLRPAGAISELVAGAESAVQVGADLVSAVDNALLNTLLQGTIGLASPDVADGVGDWLGAVTLSFMKNLPFGERSNGVIDFRDSWFHDRAFEPARYTRTDTQLNIDRGMTIINWTTLRAIRIHNRGSDGDDPIPMPDDGLPGDGAPETPRPLPR